MLHMSVKELFSAIKLCLVPLVLPELTVSISAHFPVVLKVRLFRASIPPLLQSANSEFLWLSPNHLQSVQYQSFLSILWQYQLYLLDFDNYWLLWHSHQSVVVMDVLLILLIPFSLFSTWIFSWFSCLVTFDSWLVRLAICSSVVFLGKDIHPLFNVFDMDPESVNIA